MSTLDAVEQLFTSELPKPMAAVSEGSQGGVRSSAAVNNPTGYGAIKHPDGSYTWDVYETPQAGVAATQQAVGRYLNSEGIMTGVKPTPENFVGMWVNGKPTTGSSVQGGAYAFSSSLRTVDAYAPP